MRKKIFLGIIEILIISISLSGFFSPSMLIPGGYNLSIDGVVISRTMCLIFAMANIIKLSRLFLLDEAK